MDTGEPAILKLHPHRLRFFNYYFFGIIFTIVGITFYSRFWPAIIVGILIIFLGEILRSAVTYYVLESGVARGYDLLSTSRKFAEYGNIQNMEVDQSFLEKLLGIGSISFDTSGSDTIEVGFDGVADPYGIERIVRDKMAVK